MQYLYSIVLSLRQHGRSIRRHRPPSFAKCYFPWIATWISIANLPSLSFPLSNCFRTRENRDERDITAVGKIAECLQSSSFVFSHARSKIRPISFHRITLASYVMLHGLRRVGIHDVAKLFLFFEPSIPSPHHLFAHLPIAGLLAHFFTTQHLSVSQW